MRSLSDNLLTLILATVLSIAPMQSIAASVSKCMNMDSSMHTQMMPVDSVAKMDMTTSNDTATADCCSQNECGTTHCTNISAAVIPLNSINSLNYTHTVVYQKPNVQLLSFYPSSLYRPPKI